MPDAAFVEESTKLIDLERISSPTDGIVFTLREYPIVNEGSLIARILA